MDEKGEDISDDFSEFFVENTPKTFVITNKDKKLGACCLVCPEVIETAINKLGIDCYILPSSIHEVIWWKKGRIRRFRVPERLCKTGKQTKHTSCGNTER